METTTREPIVQGIAPHAECAWHGRIVSTPALFAAVRKAEELGLVPAKTWRDYDEETINKLKAVLQAGMEADWR
jgi:hypothetical protein